MSKEKEINLGYILIDSDQFPAVGNRGDSLLYTEETCIAAMREAAQKVLEMAAEDAIIIDVLTHAGYGYKIDKQSILDVMLKVK